MRVKTKKLPSIQNYDIKKNDLSKPKIACWYLQRRIEYADWEVLEYKLLKKYLLELKIEPAMKKVLTEFIQDYEKTNSKQFSKKIA